MTDVPTTPTPQTGKPRLNVRTGLNSNQAPQKDALGRPPPRRPLMPLNPSISNLQPSRFAWNEIDVATTPLKGGALPILNGSGITVDSPDVTSRFHTEAVTAANIAVQQQPSIIGPDSPAVTSSNTNDEGCDFSPLPASPATNGFDMENASYSNSCERSFASEYNLLPRSAQSFLPTMNGPDVFIHSPDPVSRFNVRTSVPSSSAAAAITAAAANTISRGIAQIRSSLGDGEGIAARTWREPAILARGAGKYGSNGSMDGRGRSASIDGGQGLELGLEACETDNALSPPPVHNTITHRQSILLQQHHRQSTTSVNTTTNTLHPSGGFTADTSLSPSNESCSAESNHINLDQTISPYKTPDYDNAVRKIRNLQSIISGECDQRESSSLSSSASSNSIQTKGDKNTQWAKLNRSQSTTRLGVQGLGGGGGGGGEHSITSSYGMVSTYYADGSPVPQNESRPASTVSMGVPQGAKLFPMAPPSLPVAPQAGTTRSSFFERRSSSGVSCDGNTENGNNGAAGAPNSGSASAAGVAVGVVAANSPIASAFVKRGRVYRSLGAKENFAFGSPPSKAAKIVHLKGYSDITATLAAAAISSNTNSYTSSTSGAAGESKEINDGGVDDDVSLIDSGRHVASSSRGEGDEDHGPSTAGSGSEGDTVKPRRRRPPPKHPPQQPQQGHDATIAEPKHNDDRRGVPINKGADNDKDHYIGDKGSYKSKGEEGEDGSSNGDVANGYRNDKGDKGYRGGTAQTQGYAESKLTLAGSSAATTNNTNTNTNNTNSNSILLIDDINGSWLSDEDNEEEEISRSYLEGGESPSFSPCDKAEDIDEHHQSSATSSSSRSSNPTSSSSLSSCPASAEKPPRRRPREQQHHLSSTMHHHNDQSKSSFSSSSSTSSSSSSSSSLSQRVGNAIVGGSGSGPPDTSNIFYQTARDLMFSPGDRVSTNTLSRGKPVQKSISLYSPPDNDGLSPDHMEGGLDSPLSPDPSPCPSYEHTYHSDDADYEDRHCDHDRENEDDRDGSGRRTEEKTLEKTKTKPTTANWGLSTPTPRGPRGRRGASSSHSTLDDENNGDDNHGNSEGSTQALARTPIQMKQCTTPTVSNSSHASVHNQHNSNNNHVRERNNNHNPYVGKDHNPFSNQREGVRSSLTRNGGILSPVTPGLDHHNHRGSGGSGTTSAAATGSIGANDSRVMADLSPGHAAAYNHTLTTLVNNSNSDGVELSPVVLRQTKSDKLRRLRQRDHNMQNNVSAATVAAVARFTHSQITSHSQLTTRRLGLNNNSSCLSREHEEGEGRGVRTGLDAPMAKGHLRGMGEPKGRPKVQGKVTRPPAVIRISRTIAISSNFGVKNYRTSARKKKKNCVNSFVANGPLLESIPESQELDFCDVSR